MQVTVKLFAGFREGRFKSRVIELENGRTVEQIVGKFGIPAAEIGILICNGRHVDRHSELQAGDILSVFPKVGGG